MGFIDVRDDACGNGGRRGPAHFFLPDRWPRAGGVLRPSEVERVANVFAAASGSGRHWLFEDKLALLQVVTGKVQRRQRVSIRRSGATRDAVVA